MASRFIRRLYNYKKELNDNMSGKINNPVLRGFNPDPSILRVGDDYYIANSTFEWFPGVQIHHSKDLIHWKLIARPLNRLSQLDMRGEPNSGGIWAPCLSYDRGVFYLIYTDVRTKGSIFKDTHNYLVTATEICGEWSEPVYLNSSGFDPSLFHDDDGRKWLVNMVCTHKKRFAGILLQEYDPQARRLIGPVTNIFKGTELGFTEGPHLYKHSGRYYLLVAEGGTGLGHAVTIARADRINGPYEADPANPMLTSREDRSLAIQKAGHADIVASQNGEWYMAHLCGRPMPNRGYCTLGRETALQKVIWTEDGWLRLACGGNQPQAEVDAPALPEYPWLAEPVRDDFDSPRLNINFQSLRTPLDEDMLSLTERPGYLRLKGRESISSKYRQSLIARRQQAFRYTASTCVEFEPQDYLQLAGLVCFYDTHNFYYLRISRDETVGKCLGIVAAQNNQFELPLRDNEVSIAGWERCYLRADVDYDRLQFFYSADGGRWDKIGPVLDAATLSDEYCMEGQFTGAYVGICCHDQSGQGIAADFDFFEYRERE
jgi:xylan 1,4-beta-xylosidase